MAVKYMGSRDLHPTPKEKIERFLHQNLQLPSLPFFRDTATDMPTGQLLPSMTIAVCFYWHLPLCNTMVLERKASIFGRYCVQWRFGFAQLWRHCSESHLALLQLKY